MKHRLIALTAAFVAAGIAGDDTADRGGVSVRPPFRIVFVDQLEPHARKLILRLKTPSSVAALQAALTADLALSRKLRARGIAISNIIRRDEDTDGRNTYYVR